MALQSEQFHEQQHKQLLVCSKWNLLVPNIKDLFRENLLNPNVPFKQTLFRIENKAVFLSVLFYHSARREIRETDQILIRKDKKTVIL